MTEDDTRPHSKLEASPVAADSERDSSSRTLISYLCLAGALVAAGVLTFQARTEVMESLRRLTLSGLLGAGLATIATLYYNSAILRESLAFFDIRISRSEALVVASANSLWAYLPASAGVALKAAYLRRRFGLGYPRFAAVTIATVDIEIFVSTTSALVILLWAQPAAGGSVGGVAAFLALAGAGALLVLLLPLPEMPVSNKLWRLLTRVLEGWKTILRTPRGILKIVVHMLLRFLARAATLYICSVSVGANIGFAACMILTGVAALAFFLNVTPGGLGVREGLQLATATSLGYPAASILVVLLVVAAVFLLVTFTLGAAGALLAARWSNEPARPSLSPRHETLPSPKSGAEGKG